MPDCRAMSLKRRGRSASPGLSAIPDSPDFDYSVRPGPSSRWHGEIAYQRIVSLGVAMLRADVLEATEPEVKGAIVGMLARPRCGLS